MDNEKILLDALNTFGNFRSVEQEFNDNQLEVIYEAMNKVLNIRRSEQLCECQDPYEETLAMRCTGCGNLTECD